MAIWSCCRCSLSRFPPLLPLSTALVAKGGGVEGWRCIPSSPISSSLLLSCSALSSLSRNQKGF
ncbi:hypothetical protein U1Q18_010006, partial [Sarracenia purpurea var. burkii]